MSSASHPRGYRRDLFQDQRFQSSINKHFGHGNKRVRSRHPKFNEHKTYAHPPDNYHHQNRDHHSRDHERRRSPREHERGRPTWEQEHGRPTWVQERGRPSRDHHVRFRSRSPARHRPRTPPREPSPRPRFATPERALTRSPSTETQNPAEDSQLYNIAIDQDHDQADPEFQQLLDLEEIEDGEIVPKTPTKEQPDSDVPPILTPQKTIEPPSTSVAAKEVRSVAPSSPDPNEPSCSGVRSFAPPSASGAESIARPSEAAAPSPKPIHQTGIGSLAHPSALSTKAEKIGVQSIARPFAESSPIVRESKKTGVLSTTRPSKSTSKPPGVVSFAPSAPSQKPKPSSKKRAAPPPPAAEASTSGGGRKSRSLTRAKQTASSSDEEARPPKPAASKKVSDGKKQRPRSKSQAAAVAPLTPGDDQRRPVSVLKHPCGLRDRSQSRGRRASPESPSKTIPRQEVRYNKYECFEPDITSKIVGTAVCLRTFDVLEDGTMVPVCANLAYTPVTSKKYTPVLAQNEFMTVDYDRRRVFGQCQLSLCVPKPPLKPDSPPEDMDDDAEIREILYSDAERENNDSDADIESD